MKHSLMVVALVALGVLWADAAPAQENDEFRVYWSDGLRMETGDGRFQFRIGGRIMADWVFWGDSEPIAAVAGPLVDGSEFRRARLYVQGHMYERVEFKAQYDFAGGDASFKDVYFGTRGLPANVRIGHFKEPMSLEELTSSKYLTFLERGLVNAFAPSRNLGVLVHGAAAGDRLGYGVGFFGESDDFGDRTGDNYNFTGRLYVTPVYEDGGARLVHLGGAYSYRTVDDSDTLRFRQRPEVHIAPRFVDTGEMAADSAGVALGEAAVVAGPFSAQGELAVTSVDAPTLGDPTFDAYYIEASYWLTGEHRVYDGGAFDRVVPNRNFLDGAGGPGAWQVAVRLSGIDLDDGLVEGGELRNLTVGVNWQWNPMTRLMFNVVRADLDGVDDVVSFLSRAQIEF